MFNFKVKSILVLSFTLLSSGLLRTAESLSVTQQIPQDYDLLLEGSKCLVFANSLLLKSSNNLKACQKLFPEFMEALSKHSEETFIKGINSKQLQDYFVLLNQTLNKIKSKKGENESNIFLIGTFNSINEIIAIAEEQDNRLLLPRNSMSKKHEKVDLLCDIFDDLTFYKNLI